MEKEEPSVPARHRLERERSKGEELANTLSHGVGLLAAIVGAPVLVSAAWQRGGRLTLVGVSVFAASAMLLYLASTLYHAWPPTSLKKVFRKMDHASIFCLIAGTYTPFTLGPLRGTWGWVILAVVWALAIFGVFLTVLAKVRHERLSVGLYLGMGWLIVAAIRPLCQHVAAPGLYWLVAGGLAYTVGVVFYIDKRSIYAHFLWHLFVLAGTACHYCAILWYSF